MTSHPPIARRFDGERILLTGGTGFLAKSLLERILSSLPGVACVHLLIRPRDTVAPEARVRSEVFSSDAFDELRRMHGPRFDDLLADKVSVVAGDLTRDRLGLDPDAYARLASDVTLVINCAALCSFDAPLDQALQTNTLGAKRVLQFARDAGAVPLIHLSTCYVGATLGTVVGEAPLLAGHTPNSGSVPAFDLDDEVRSLLDLCEQTRAATGTRSGRAGVIDLGRREASRRGWHDVYQFTKALGEQYLSRDHGPVPLRIVRPTIVESTHEVPRPGWIDGIRMADPIILEYGRGHLLRFVGSEDTVLDLVPCDMVSNLILAARPPRDAVADQAVYQLASSTWNPVTLGELAEWAFEAFEALAERHPRQIPPPAQRGRWVGEDRFRRELRWKRRALEWRRRIQRGLGLERGARRSTSLLRMLGRAEHLTDLYAFYTCSSPRFDGTRTRGLLDGLTAQDRADFSFDLAEVDWRDYLKRRHIPGLLRLNGFDPTLS